MLCFLSTLNRGILHQLCSEYQLFVLCLICTKLIWNHITVSATYIYKARSYVMRYIILLFVCIKLQCYGMSEMDTNKWRHNTPPGYIPGNCLIAQTIWPQSKTTLHKEICVNRRQFKRDKFVVLGWTCFTMFVVLPLLQLQRHVNEWLCNRGYFWRWCNTMLATGEVLWNNIYIHI